MILLDTTVLIDILRGRSAVKAKISEFAGEDFYISAISIKELYHGLGYSKQKKGEQFYLKKLEGVKSLISDFNVIPVRREILELTGLKEGELQAKGMVIDVEDIIIGISAEMLKVTSIITRNPKHFKEFKLITVIYKK